LSTRGSLGGGRARATGVYALIRGVAMAKSQWETSMAKKRMCCRMPGRRAFQEQQSGDPFCRFFGQIEQVNNRRYDRRNLEQFQSSQQKLLRHSVSAESVIATNSMEATAPHHAVSQIDVYYYGVRGDLVNGEGARDPVRNSPLSCCSHGPVPQEPISMERWSTNDPFPPCCWRFAFCFDQPSPVVLFLTRCGDLHAHAAYGVSSTNVQVLAQHGGIRSSFR
jgi:hypothetical protein